MTQMEMETRIARLEQELNTVKAKIADIEKKEKPNRAWWKDHVGIFADDPAHEEAMRLGREWRKAQREDYDKD
jgi:hypothetical protein